MAKRLICSVFRRLNGSTAQRLTASRARACVYKYKVCNSLFFTFENNV